MLLLSFGWSTTKLGMTAMSDRWCGYGQAVNGKAKEIHRNRIGSGSSIATWQNAIA